MEYGLIFYVFLLLIINKIYNIFSLTFTTTYNQDPIFGKKMKFSYEIQWIYLQISINFYNLFFISFIRYIYYIDIYYYTNNGYF